MHSESFASSSTEAVVDSLVARFRRFVLGIREDPSRGKADAATKALVRESRQFKEQLQQLDGGDPFDELMKNLNAARKRCPRKH